MAAMTTLTLDEFLTLEETKPYKEYACGEAFEKPMPNLRHSGIQIWLGAALLAYLGQTRIGSGFTELRCIFGPPGRQRAYLPDVSYVSRERLTPGLSPDSFLPVAPDLAVEILSPDQHMAHFLDKIQFYLLYGVRLVWVIDPSTSTVTVQQPGQEARILRPGDVLDGDDVLPGFSLPVDGIFAQLSI